MNLKDLEALDRRHKVGTAWRGEGDRNSRGGKEEQEQEAG